MTARERLLLSLEHRQPDRVPLDIGATPSSSISAIAYNRLKAKLGISAGYTRVYDLCQQVVLPEPWLLDRFGVDVIDIAQAWDTAETDWRPVTLSDGSCAEYPVAIRTETQPDGSKAALLKDGSVGARMPNGATFFDQTVFPYLKEYPKDYRELSKAMGQVSWSAFVHAPWNHSEEATFFTELRERTHYLRENTDRALMIVCGCNLFEWGTFLRRIDEFLMDLIAEPDEVERFLDALLEKHLQTLEKVCDAVGDLVDILRFGDDLGMDSGPLMNPSLYRRYFKPRHVQLCDYVKKHSGMKTFLHSCGSLYQLFPDLIEAGFDIINPVQTSAKGMDPARLKKDFGNDIVFWGGGVDTRQILNHGTPQMVRDDVKRRLEVFMPDGGFVFGAIHNIMPDCPPQNILAMFETLEQFGSYT